MAIRALADDVQDHIERIGRMVNEDLPAIADQMVGEFGIEQASQIKDPNVFYCYEGLSRWDAKARLWSFLPFY